MHHRPINPRLLPAHLTATALSSLPYRPATSRLTTTLLPLESHLKTLCSNGRLKEALQEMCFIGEKLKFGGYDSLLTECINRRALREGQRVHAHMIKSRYLPPVYLGTRIVVMYVKCGSLDDARQVLEGMTDRTVVSWTAVISGYAKRGYSAKALDVFVEMIRTGTFPNEFTLSAMLAACAKPSGLEHGRQLHSLALKSSLESHIFVGSSLLDMYVKAGKIHEARGVFDMMPGRDVVSCTAIISGYAQLGLDEEALGLFRQLHKEGLNCNYVTFASLLTALCGLSALDYGRQVHGHTIRCQLPFYVVLQNSLIDMYSKCGSLLYARRIFDHMFDRTVSSWNAMLVGYAKHGLGKDVVKLFRSMLEKGVEPDRITFMAVLSGCGHGGLVDEGLYLFDSMVGIYSVKPEIEHYACVVDLLGRAGRVENALDFIENMPFQPSSAIWSSLLSACRFHGNVSVAESLAQNLFQIDPENAVNYVNLSNIYAAAGRWEDVLRVRRLIMEKAVQKEPGQSWIVLDKTVHSFRANDQFHPKMEEINTKIRDLYTRIKEVGYVPDHSCVLHDVDDEQKEWILLGHSEKF